MLGRTKSIHFVGIGGIGMSGIAEFLFNQGLVITGSDMRKSELTDHLESIGIKVVEGHDSDLALDADVVVKSSAVTDDNPEIKKTLNSHIPVIRRAEMLAEITRMSIGIGLAGTHGKTSTTSMVGMILDAAELDPTIIVGGRVKNFGSNNIIGSGKYIVVEADEYDHSFLTLSPIFAGITNIDADHLDCYKDLDAIKDAFVEYANKVPFFGCVVVCLDDKGVQDILPRINKRIMTYGFSRQADLQAINLKFKNFRASFDVVFNSYKLGSIDLQVTGKHNIQNALNAIGIALELDIPFESIQAGLNSYSGVFRRFEYKGEAKDIIVYDDYAHHPTEIIATLEGFRESTDKRIVLIFQPHLYSRTRDFHQEFGRSFFSCDLLFIAPIYPAREEPIPGITSQLIADSAIKTGHQNVHYIENMDDMVDVVMSHLKPNDIVVTMGAGTIYKKGEEILERLNEGK